MWSARYSKGSSRAHCTLVRERSDSGSVTIEFALLVPVLVATLALGVDWIGSATTDAQARVLVDVAALHMANGRNEPPELDRLRSVGEVTIDQTSIAVCVAVQIHHRWLGTAFTTTTRTRGCHALRP